MLFEDRKVKRELLGYSIRVTTNGKSAEGEVIGLDEKDDNILFKNGSRFPLLLTSQITKLLPMTREEAFKKFKENLIILHENPNIEGWEEQVKLANDYMINFRDGSWILWQGEDLERVIKEHNRILLLNMLENSQHKIAPMHKFESNARLEKIGLYTSV